MATTTAPTAMRCARRRRRVAREGARAAPERASSIPPAGGAEPVEGQRVIVDLEAAGQGHALEDGHRAGRVQLEDLAAALAAEVVVVPAAGTLVAGRLVRQVDGHDVAVLGEDGQVAVHGGEAEAGVVGGGALEHLLRREGAGGLVEGLQDGAALGGLTHDAASVPPASAGRRRSTRTGSRTRRGPTSLASVSARPRGLSGGASAWGRAARRRAGGGGGDRPPAAGRVPCS